LSKVRAGRLKNKGKRTGAGGRVERKLLTLKRLKGKKLRRISKGFGERIKGVVLHRRGLYLAKNERNVTKASLGGLTEVGGWDWAKIVMKPWCGKTASCDGKKKNRVGLATAFWGEMICVEMTIKTRRLIKGGQLWGELTPLSGRKGGYVGPLGVFDGTRRHNEWGGKRLQRGDLSSARGNIRGGERTVIRGSAIGIFNGTQRSRAML